MPPRDPDRGLVLLSLDGGGVRGISQLKILADLMRTLCYKDTRGAQTRESELPCAVFDAISGVGSGGFIAILLVVFGMTAEEALKTFINIAQEVFGDDGAGDPSVEDALEAFTLDERMFLDSQADSEKRTKRLVKAVEMLLEQHGLAKDANLLDDNERSNGCKLIVPVTHKVNVGATSKLRNYTSNEPPLNITILEAILTTMSTPPLFTPTRIQRGPIIQEYVSGDTTLINPIRELVSEAYDQFGTGRSVACLLSVGAGHGGVTPVPNGSSISSRMEFLERIVRDGERTAQEVQRQMGHLGLYRRLSVNQGMEGVDRNDWSSLGVILTSTVAYLQDSDVQEALESIVECIKVRENTASLEQLRHSGGAKVSAPVMPSLTPYYVERPEAMDVLTKGILPPDEEGVEEEQRIMVISGLGGCGKTQLVLKFIKDYGTRFQGVFFVDGTSEARIRSDLLRHARSRGAEHSQISFEEALLYLSDPVIGEHLIVYDNVDDQDLDIAPFLPERSRASIIITTRNPSLSDLSPNNHLELDTLTLPQGLELLLRTSRKPDTPANRAAAEPIVQELSFHPIALVQAGTYMHQTKSFGEAYLKKIRMYRKRLMDQPVKNQRHMRYASAYAAFDASYDGLEPNARRFLHFLSFSHWRNFPLAAVYRSAEKSFSHEAVHYVDTNDEFASSVEFLKEIFCLDGEWDELEMDSMLTALQNYSFITVADTSISSLLTMHPLAHQWANDRVATDLTTRYTSATVRLLSSASEFHRETLNQYIAPHVDNLLLQQISIHINDKAGLAEILRWAGLVEAAMELQKGVVETLREVLGPEDDITLRAAHELSHSLSALNRDIESGELLLDVLRVRRERLGDDHPDTIEALSSAALSVFKLGQFTEGAELQKRALESYKRVLGDDHKDTMLAAEHLAVLLGQLGRYSEVEDLQLELCMHHSDVFGEEHPNTLRANLRLAKTWSAMGRYLEAKELQTGCVALYLKVLGEEHPDTVNAIIDLADTCDDLQDHSEAEEWQLAVVAIQTRTLGISHPKTIGSMLVLVRYQIAMDRLVEAAELTNDVGTLIDCLPRASSDRGSLSESLELMRELLLIKGASTAEDGDV